MSKQTNEEESSNQHAESVSPHDEHAENEQPRRRGKFDPHCLWVDLGGEG